MNAIRRNPSSDSTNVDREAFDRDGHDQAASVGSTASVTMSAVKTRVAAAEFNPFKKQDEKEVRRSRMRRGKACSAPGEVEKWRGSRGEPHI